MRNPIRQRIGEVLIQRKLVKPEQVDEALKIQKDTKEKIGDILVRLGHLSRENLLEVLSVELGIPIINPLKMKITPEVIMMIPKRMAETYCLIPVARDGKSMTLAMANPMNVHALDDIHSLTGMEIRPMLAGEKEVKEAIEQYYGENLGQSMQSVMKDIEEGGKLELQEGGSAGEGTEQDLLRLTQEEPVVKLTNSILSEGVKRRASDIFIEPEEKNLRVRFRVDGLLQEGLMTSRMLHSGVVSRIKVMSNLDIAEHRIPQDGRFKVKVNSMEVDFRISVLPTYFGEKVVLRILDKNQALLDIEKLGFEPEPMAVLKKAAEHPHGMILVCGPTGAGKTTTLYSVLKLIDSPEKNIVTVEDPVEFQIDGINQVAIRTEVDLTFAAALRSILRQDPDIIMVGEIRDSETADVSIKAALTGHLVLSTLHATTAVGAITRFVNMGVEPFLITSSVLMTGSQRLVRRICLKCKEPYEPSKELIHQLGINPKQLPSGKVHFYRGKGCEHCGNKGYAGRAVLLEALAITPKIKELILKGAQEYEIKAQGRKEGMKTLRDNGIAKILAGVTTPEEVMRVTIRDEEAAP